MTLETLIKIRNNPYFYNFLRENSYWYKRLNRDPEALKDMEIEVKNYYKLNLSDKLSDLNSKINIIKNLINILE